jgi:hypothetical protein
MRWLVDFFIIGWRNENIELINVRNKMIPFLKFIGSAFLVTLTLTILFLIFLGLIVSTVIIAQTLGLSAPFLEEVKVFASWAIAIGYLVYLAGSLLKVVIDIFREIFGKPNERERQA